MNKHCNCEPPKQKIKTTIGEIAVKCKNHLSVPEIHNHSSLPPGTLSTRMPSYPSGMLSREASPDCCSSILKEGSDSSLSVPILLQHLCCNSERAVAWGNTQRLQREIFVLSQNQRSLPRCESRSVHQGQGLPPAQVTEVELIQHIPTLGKMSALLPLIAL